ncbi:MAG: MvaI/BcnI family restriction endonuclease [Candidatus Thorarchaeota archaeon]
MDFDEFMRKIEEIRDEGFIPTHRTGDTGIGKTLEDKLGITENNISGPDFGVYELKSGRRQSDTMVTLFTKTPAPKGSIKNLVDNFGYKHRKGKSKGKQTTLTDDELESSQIPPEDKELHVTVDALRPNSVGLQLAFENDKLYFKNDKGIDAHYTREVLQKTLAKKYGKLIYVIADTKRINGKENFHYNEAYRLEGFSFNTLAKLIKDGLLKVDLRVGHYPNGRVHDHGTGFRIKPEYFTKCFDKIERIM